MKKEIEEIYKNVESQKLSVESVQASSAVAQLKEVEEKVFKIIQESDRLIENSNMKDYQEIKNEYMSKLHQPDDLHNFFKSHMAMTSRHNF